MRHTASAHSRLTQPLLTIAAVVAVGLPGIASAFVSGDLAVEVLVGGRPSREYQARGTTYVEALHGAEYSLRLSNRCGSRIAVALAVDGLNSIDARTTSAAAAAKWVLDPWETVTIDGWQMSQQAARRFVFTTEPESYGAWLGRTDNLGVIEAVVFRERPLARECVDPAMPSQKPEAGAGREQAGAAAPMSGQDKRSAASAPSDEHAATGIGRRVDNPVQRVDLELEPEPSTRVRIRYEYRPQLVALGVLPPPLPDPLDRREQARGFSDSDFCPDPYRSR